MPKVLELEGTMGCSIQDSTIEMRAERVVNNRNGGTSGTLRLSLWATKKFFSGGTLRGRVLGSSKLDPLEGGYQYEDITKTASYDKPPGGYYYLTMILEEYDSSSDDNWPMMDYVTFDGKIFLGKEILLEGLAYAITGSAVELKVRKLTHNRPHQKSEKLRIILLATEFPYTGDRTEGYILAKT